MVEISSQGLGDLIVAIVLDAAETYASDKVGEGGFVTAKMEALTFFHGDTFERYCDYIGADQNAVRNKHGIPAPSSSCMCESCRTDYTPEAYLASKRKPNSKIRFSPGQKHHVFWRNNNIYRVLPRLRDGKWITAKAYLRRKHEKLSVDQTDTGANQSSRNVRRTNGQR